MLQVEGLHLRRGSNEVLHDIHLQLSPGQVVGVLGPNGAGKSSLLGVLCGELAPDRGQVTLQGRPLVDWGGQERARRLAVLPQVSSLGFSFRVEEVVSMGRMPHGTGQRRDAEIVAAALQAADAWHLVDRSYLA
jgi:iron complex transport system ATP-binding protein